MALKIQDTKANEWVLLHDFYHESPEPDAPKAKFENLSNEEKTLATSHFNLPNYKAVMDGETLLGFVGFFPDDDDNVNIFYVISPEHRGKGYLAKILNESIAHCRSEFAGYKYVRALTRKQNIHSIQGLVRASFIRKGTVVEEVQPDVAYEEYLLQIAD